jgi:hypothetical protein
MANRIPNRRSLSVLLLMAAAAWLGAQSAAPAADAVVLKQVREYRLAPDGGIVLHVYEQKKLLTGFAMNRLLGETFIPYAEGWQELKVNRCVTTMVDGTKVPTPENGYNPITHPDAYEFPQLCYLREMVVSHTGLEVGAVIELDYTLTSKPGFQPFLEGAEAFGGTLPIQDLSVTVTVPKTAALAWFATGSLPKPLVKPAGAEVRYEWHAANAPVYPEERLSPDRCLVVPTLYFTTAKSWKERLAKLPAAALDESSVEAALGGPVAEPPSMALLLKVADRVAEGVRRVNLTPAMLGGAVADPAQVHARCYGTGLEKALYLEAVLVAAGFKDARLAAVLPPDSAFGKDAGLPAVKEWRVRVPGPDADVLVGTEGDLAVTSDSGACLVRDARTGELLTGSEARPARLAFQCRAKDWDGGRCKLEGTLELAGRLFKAERMAADAGKEAEKMVGDLLHEWGAEKIQVKVHGGGVQGLSCSFTAESSALFRAAGDFRTFPVPVPAAVSAWRDLYRVPDRHTAVLLPLAPLSVRMDLTLELPAGMTLEYVPGTLKADNVAADFTQEVSADGKQVTLRRTTDVPKAQLPAAECAGFKKVVASWFTDSQNEIILKLAK